MGGGRAGINAAKLPGCFPSNLGGKSASHLLRAYPLLLVPVAQRFIVVVIQEMVLGILPTTDQIRYMKDGGMCVHFQ